MKGHLTCLLKVRYFLVGHVILEQEIQICWGPQGHLRYLSLALANLAVDFELPNHQIKTIEWIALISDLFHVKLHQNLL